MANTKNARIRYQVLDECFSNRFRQFTFDDLLDRVNEILRGHRSTKKGISVRTLRGDINFMRSEDGFRAPIEVYEGPEGKYYRYADPGFSIQNAPLTPQQVDQLKATLKTLSMLEGLPQLEWLDEIVAQLKIQADRADGDPVIQFDHNRYYKGMNWFQEILDAILERQPLCVGYQPFREDKPRDIIIHPYFLKQYNNRWYLFGWNDDLEKVINLALDRVESIHDEKVPFKPNADFSLTDLTDEIVGVTYYADRPLEKVELWAEAAAADYILTKPLHGSQKAYPQEDGSYHFQIEVRPNYELEQLLFSFGEKIRVMAPEGLREKMRDRVSKMLESYS